MSRKSYRDDVADFFRAHPNQWIDGLQLALVGGAYAWRTRVSECRDGLGMTIENEVRQMPNTRRKVSLYRFVPISHPAQADLLEMLI